MPARGQLAGAPIRSAPAAKINANKSKEMQGKKLSFPWILLVESGLFNGLQRIQAKKSHGPRFLHFVSAITPCPCSPDSLGDPDQSGEQQQYSTHSDFRKDNVRPRSGRWFMCQPVPHGWRWWPGRGDGIRTQAAAAKDRHAQFRGSDHPARDTKWPQSSCASSFARCARASIQLN
jgi:hypothetical protein